MEKGKSDNKICWKRGNRWVEKNSEIKWEKEIALESIQKSAYYDSWTMTNLLSPSISFSNWTVELSNFDCTVRLRMSLLKGSDWTDQIGLSRPKWTKMYRSGPNGPNSSEADQVDRSDWIDRSRREYTKLDWSGPIIGVPYCVYIVGVIMNYYIDMYCFS